MATMTYFRFLSAILVVCLLLVRPSEAQYYGYNSNYNQYLQQGCMWGMQAVPVPGQCGAFQCVMPWFGSYSYASQCPQGTLFSARERACVSPLQIAAQCGGGGAASTYSNLWVG